MLKTANIKWIIIALLIINTASATIQTSSLTTGLTPGKTGILTIRITNPSSTNTVYDTKIVLTGIDAPLISNKTCNECTSYSSTQKVCLTYKDYCYLTLGDLYSLNTKESVFKINVPETIESGVYIANFEVEYGYPNLTSRVTETHRETISVPITITNTNVKPDINVKSITTPEVIHPGEEFNITIELENTGKINAKELNLELISGVFEITGKTNKVYLGELGINEITTANYTIITDAKTTPGIYTIELNMTYSDDNKTYNKKTDTGVLVDGTTDFKVFIQDISPDIITKDTEINALISIANTGIINAESVTIQINPCNDIKLGNVNQDFIGDLDTGDFTTTSFKFKPAKEGELKVGLTIEYMTPSGKKTTFNTTETIIINYSQAVTSAPKVTFSDVMLVIVAVMIIAYFLKKRRKSKK